MTNVKLRFTEVRLYLSKYPKYKEDYDVMIGYAIKSRLALDSYYNFFEKSSLDSTAIQLERMQPEINRYLQDVEKLLKEIKKLPEFYKSRISDLNNGAINN